MTLQLAHRPPTKRFVCSGPAPALARATDPAAVDPRLESQLHELRRTLQRLGAKLELVPRIPDDPFVRDHTVLFETVRGPRALVCRRPGIDRATLPLATALTDRGYSVTFAPEGLAGGDVVLMGRRVLAARREGVIERQVERAVRLIGPDLHVEWLDVDPRLARLEAAVASLDDGAVFFCPHALGLKAARQLCELMRGEHEVVPVSLPECLGGGLRWIQVGDTALVGQGGFEVMAQLRKRGLQVSPVAVDRVQRLGRGASCLVVPVRQTFDGASAMLARASGSELHVVGGPRLADDADELAGWRLAPAA